MIMIMGRERTSAIIITIAKIIIMKIMMMESK